MVKRASASNHLSDLTLVQGFAALGRRSAGNIPTEYRPQSAPQWGWSRTSLRWSSTPILLAHNARDSRLPPPFYAPIYIWCLDEHLINKKLNSQRTHFLAHSLHTWADPVIILGLIYRRSVWLRRCPRVIRARPATVLSVCSLKDIAANRAMSCGAHNATNGVDSVLRRVAWRAVERMHSWRLCIVLVRCAAGFEVHHLILICHQ